MRGDSRLDFYAKSLAVLLLGSLGLAGAVVDRWPGSANLPDTAPPSVIALNPIVQTAFDLPGFTEPLTGIVRSADARPARPAVVRAVAERRTGPHIADSFAGTAALPVSRLSEPISDVLPQVELVALRSAPPLDAPAISSLASADPSGPIVPTLGSSALDQSEDGFFSGVLKKTGSSVTTSLGKASTSVVGAVRVVSDTFRRAF